jgi:hypothetical protein
MRVLRVVLVAFCALPVGITSAAADGAARSTVASKTCEKARAQQKQATQRRTYRTARQRKARAAIRIATLRRCRPGGTAAPELLNVGSPGSDLPTPPGPSSPSPTAPPAEELGHSVQVRALEYSLALSRSVVAAGEVNVEFHTVNAEDPHDLNLRDANGAERPLFDETPAGQIPPPRQAFAFARGDYVLFCSLPGHEALGMSAKLRVR